MPHPAAGFTRTLLLGVKRRDAVPAGSRRLGVEGGGTFGKAQCCRIAGQWRRRQDRAGARKVPRPIEPERLREVLEVEISTYEQEMKLSARIWEAAGGYSPTIGILGAVMVLIHVMENLSDPSKLGAGIAVAFVATIYGVGSANLVYLPMANKLKTHISRLIVQREMIVDGLVGIANGDNPRIIESRLRGYLF